jgi:HEAT repeat protein
MKMMLLFFAGTLLTVVVGCSAVTEQDLADLQTANAVVKEEAIKRISRDRPFPVSLISAVLGNTGEKRAVAVMVALLRSGREPPDVQLTIIKALGNLSKRMEVPAPLFIEMLKSKDPRIRAATIEALGKMRSRKALGALLHLLEEKPDEYAAIWAVGEMTSPEAIPTLNQLLASENKYSRFNAYRSLKKTGRQAEETSDETETNSGRSLLDIVGMAFKRYQGAMMAVFEKLTGLNRV